MISFVLDKEREIIAIGQLILFILLTSLTNHDSSIHFRNTQSDFELFTINPLNISTHYEANFPSPDIDTNLSNCGVITCTEHSTQLTPNYPFTSIHVLDQYENPSAGTYEFNLPHLIDDVEVWADGVPLPYSIEELDYSLEPKLQITIPSSINMLEIEYQILDGSLAYEDKWYLEYLGSRRGPITITVILPFDAEIISYSSPEFASIIGTHTLHYDIPDGKFAYLIIVYETTVIPEHYYTATSEHFHIVIPQIYAPYEANLVKILEFIYERYHEYLGYDLNEVTGKDRLIFYFPPTGWDNLVGGLCVFGGPCWVNRQLVPRAEYRPYNSPFSNLFLMVSHELAHGWQYLINQGFMPFWINEIEGFPYIGGVHAAADLGVCSTAYTTYHSAYTNFLEYLDDPTTNHTSANAVISTGLIASYGWDWLREVHKAIENGTLNLAGFSDQEKNDHMVVFLSQTIGENLVPYFDQNMIISSQWVRDTLTELPSSNATVPTEWNCPLGILNVNPTSIVFLADPGGWVSPPQVVHIGNCDLGEIIWTIIEDPSVEWLSLSIEEGRSMPLYTASVVVSVDNTSLSEGIYVTELIVSGQPGTGNSPSTVQVELLIDSIDHTYLPVVHK